MCGIIGYVGERDCSDLIFQGLRRLEYRGYDSAGLALINGDGIQLIRAEGNLDVLEKLLSDSSVKGTQGIGHTRWATHGAPSERNAHPHLDCTGDIAIVHNGIIENHHELSEGLISRGHRLVSDTDSEVIAHLLEEAYQGDLREAMRAVISHLEGSFAIAALSAKEPGVLVAARQDSPLVVAKSGKESFLASAAPALLPHTDKLIRVEDGDIVRLVDGIIEIQDMTGALVERPPLNVTWSAEQAEKGIYPDYMLKEIHEQPKALRDTLKGRFLPDGGIALDELKMSEDQIKALDRIYILACGTSYHAGLIGKYFLEKWTGLPVEIEVSSEFRYRDAIMSPGTLLVAISQSGETADTLAGARGAQAKGSKVMAIVNVVGSLLAQEADAVIYTHAGLEIGVAATKTLLAQLAALYTLGLYLGRAKGTLSQQSQDEIKKELLILPDKIAAVLENEEEAKRIADIYKDYRSLLFLGRGIGFPVALEGALKLKEISYIHAEGYPAGEMKHGPIALLDETCPVLAVATDSPVRDKVISNIEEARARKAEVMAVGTEGDEEIARLCRDVFWIPPTLYELTPVLALVPLQLFSYHVAKLKGCNVDQPRNLAKSVTVE